MNAFLLTGLILSGVIGLIILAAIIITVILHFMDGEVAKGLGTLFVLLLIVTFGFLCVGMCHQCKADVQEIQQQYNK